MKFTKVTNTKTPEGTHAVSLVHEHTVVATIVFPTETLAKEYADFKSTITSGPESPATKAVMKDFNQMLSNDKHEQVMDTLYAQQENKSETPAVVEPAPEVAPVESKPVKRKQPGHIDVSAKAAKDVDVDISAKPAKSIDVDVSAKGEFSGE